MDQILFDMIWTVIGIGLFPVFSVAVFWFWRNIYKKK